MVDIISEEMENNLILLQRRIVDEKRPVLVVFEGRSGRVLGRVINEFMNLMDPRGVTYSHFLPTKDYSPREILRYISREPPKGKIAIFERSWYSRYVGFIEENIDTKEIRTMSMALEKYFTDNGVIVVKIFLDITADAFRNELKKSDKKKDGSFLSDDHLDPNAWSSKVIGDVLSRTDTLYAPWDVIKYDEDLGATVSHIVQAFISRVNYRIEYGYQASEERVVAILPNLRTSVDLTRTASRYKTHLAELSDKLTSLQFKLASSSRSLVLVFEGWDAAGKGGTIRRVSRALHPRGYYVNPVAAPAGDERLHTYLWRFAVSAPKSGHVVIYDRSWYGRMMVEPIEGFCTEEEYGRSANEIRMYERGLVDSGAIVLKFWMEISPDEQLRRFEARQNDPLKQYKITDEDWRNRDKWVVYETYIDRMISSTNTPYAPWFVVESEDKKYGRLKVLETITEVLERELKDRYD